MRRSSRDPKARVGLGVAVFVVGMTPVFIREPLDSLVYTLGTAIAIGAVLIAVRRFRDYSGQRIPGRFADSDIPSIRVVTRAVSGYATGLVGFYTLIAVLVLFSALGAFF